MVRHRPKDCARPGWPAGPPVLHVRRGHRLVLSLSPSGRESGFRSRCRGDSLLRSQFIECASSFLFGNILRQLAVLEKASRAVVTNGIPRQFRRLPPGSAPGLCGELSILAFPAIRKPGKRAEEPGLSAMGKSA